MEIDKQYYTGLTNNFRNEIKHLKHRDCKEPGDLASFITATAWMYFEAVWQITDSEEEFINLTTQDINNFLDALRE